MGKVINLASGGGIRPDKLRPVGSIYQSMVATDPGLLFGGVWEKYAQGRVLVGLHTADTDFNAVGKTGGEKAHALTAAEMPAHNHVFTLTATSLATSGAHTHSIQRSWGTNAGSYNSQYVAGGGGAYLIANGAHSHTVTVAGSIANAGGGGAHNNLMPYMAVHMWKRVA